jgi:AraC-like DNA-binding protein/CheY-like chemotaxis protein
LLVRQRVAEPLVARAIAFIDEHYRDHTLRSTLAAELGAPPTVLSAAFRRATGETPTDYLRSVRLTHAAVLLVDTKKRIKEIRWDVGYNDDSNFTHDFTQRFGTSPLEYRKRGVHPATPIAREQPPQDRRNPSAQRHHILVIDDDEVAAASISAYLRMNGNHVFEATSVGQGLAHTTEHPIDVVLVDYRLGEDLDGIDYLRVLRSQRIQCPPAAALFTADWDVYERTDELRALGALVLLKPCDPDHVQDLVLYLSA